MATILETLRNFPGGNKLNKALYTSWFAPFMPVTPARNYTADLVAGYMDNDTIYSIVNKIADTASALPLTVEDKDGEPVEGHWLNELLAKPNEDNTLKEIIYNYYVYLLSIGNSYIYAPKISNGKALELWTMPSDIVLVVSGQFYEPIKSYKIIEGNQEVLFEKDQVMHGKLFNPRFLAGSWVYGLSPISVAAEMIRGLDAGQERMAVMAEKGGPPYLISAQVPEGLNQQQQELLEDTYKRKYMGSGNASNPMLSGTPLKVDKLGSNSTDLELIEASEYGLRVLCNVYGVSSVLFNDNASSTYNNVSQARKDFYQFTIQPLNAQFEMKLKQFLVPNEDVYVKFDYSNVEVLQEGFLKQAESLRQTWELTGNEKRARLGYAPITAPEMDEILVPTGYVPIGDLNKDDEIIEPFLDISENGNSSRKVSLSKV